MFVHVRGAKHLHDYVNWVRFNDRAIGEVDLSDELVGEMFEPLRNLSRFKSFHVDPDIETIVWDNGADLAPDFLYEKMKALA